MERKQLRRYASAKPALQKTLKKTLNRNSEPDLARNTKETSKING